jgi:hypothetical protein
VSAIEVVPPRKWNSGDGAERVRRGFHRIAAQRAVNVQIDEARREITAAKVTTSAPRLAWRFGNLLNPSVANHERTAFNRIRQNELSVYELHVPDSAARTDG